MDKSITSNKEATPQWTDHLISPLDRALRDKGPWVRVEESKKGGWYCLHGESSDHAVNWFHVNAEGKMKPLAALDDTRLPAISTAMNHWISTGTPVELLAWRIGSRAIFRLGPDKFAKIFRKDRQILKRWKCLASGNPKRNISVPAVLDWQEDIKTLTLEAAPGKSLNSLWKSGLWDPRHGTALDNILEWLSESDITEDLPSHTTDDEIEILEKRLQVFNRMLSDAPEDVTPLVEKVISRLKSLDSQEPVLCHRDFHDKQVLVSGDETYLLDMDLLAYSDPGLDVGNIIAHMRLRSYQGCPVPWKEVALKLIRSANSRGVDSNRIKTWTASTFTRLLLIYSRRNRPDSLLHQLKSDLDDLLHESGDWQGVL
ncbi:MAG: phosphotransferase [Planctomycetota bacterium]|nr:phosphotransferase [Planctomycetota bacterium]